MTERGENLDGHLLPTLERLQDMTRDERVDLRNRVAEWAGPLVDVFRDRVDALDAEP